MTTVKEIRSVQNACAVIDVVADRQPIGVSELARLTGIDKSAVHRIAMTLHGSGWLTRATGPTTRWQLAPPLLRLARLAADGLGASVRPVLERLRDETGETAMLAVLEGTRLVVREVAESRQALRMSSRPGADLPIGGSAAARIIAGYLPARHLADLRAAHPDLDDDRALAVARRRGYATNDREVTEDVRAVAAALLMGDGTAAGAIVVCGPSTRITAQRMRRLGITVSAAAAAWNTSPERASAARPATPSGRPRGG
jgi:IclR family transcriptional regulator, acetate operon repressor